MTVNRKMPALSESAFLRYVNFIGLYFAEGLQMGMLFVGMPAWLAMNNKTPGKIRGFAAACALPWTFKFVVAPLMDRYTYLPMGRKRTNVFYSQVFATADLIGGIAGMFIGGYLIEWFGRKRMINLYFLLIILITSALILLKPYWTSTPFLYGFIITYRWLNAFAKIGVYTIAMQCCSKLMSASQFTMYMTLGAVGSMFGATLIGPIKENVGWELTFLAFVLMILFAWLGMQFINIDRQVEQITELENEEAERELLLT